METSAGLIPWCFGSIMLFGVGYLLLTLIMGEIAEFGGGLLEGLDGILEGFGIDIFPESVSASGAEGKGISCGLIAAFLAGFGVTGVISSIAGLGVLASIALSLLSGILAGGLYFGLAFLLIGQEASTFSRNQDLIGQQARMTTNTAAGEMGEAMLEVRGTRKKYAVLGLDESPLQRGDVVEIERIEGATLYVRVQE